MSTTATPRTCGHCGKAIFEGATVWRFNEDPRPFCCINCLDVAMRELREKGRAS